MYGAIIFATDGPIATIKLNRPDKLNAFGGTMREEILDVLAKLSADETIRVLDPPAWRQRRQGLHSFPVHDQ